MAPPVAMQSSAARSERRSSPAAARGGQASLGQVLGLVLVLGVICALLVLLGRGAGEGAAVLEGSGAVSPSAPDRGALAGTARGDEGMPEAQPASLPGAGRSEQPDGVRLRGDGRIRGRALARLDGAPVPGARVQLLAFPPAAAPVMGRMLRIGGVPQEFEGRARPVAVTTTDAAGEFQFEGVRRGKFYLDVISEYYLPESPQQVRVLASGEGGPVDVWMLLGGSIAGVVVDSEGRPLGDVRVMLEPGVNLFLESVRQGVFRILEARTDGQGRFLFGGVAPGRGYELTATAPEIAVSHETSVDVAVGETTEVVLRARRGGRVVGRVFSVAEGAPDAQVASGQRLPIAGAHVGAIPRGLRDMRYLEEILLQTHCVTDAQGNYAMDRVPPGEIDVVAYAPQHLLGGGAALTVHEAQTSPAPAVELARGDLLHGRFVDGEGAPVAGVHVRWQTFDFRELTERGMQLSFAPILAMAVEGFVFPESDAQGRFVAGPFPGDEPHRILYYKPGFSDSAYDWTPGEEAEEVEIVLHRGGALEGVVMDLEAAEPITAFTIETIDRIEATADEPGRLNPFAGGEPFEDPAGRFRIEALRAGPVELTFRADGYAPRTLEEVEIVEGQERRGLIVTLSSGGTLRGSVVDDRGEGIAGANVLALDPLQRLGGGFRLRAGDFETVPTRMPDIRELLPPGLLGYAAGLGLLGDEAVRTRADGSFELRGVEAGPCVVVAFHPSFASGHSDGLEVVPGETLEGIEIELERGAGVYGTVSDRHGAPIPDSMVVALSPRSMGAGRAKDVGGGFFQSGTNSAGEYEIDHMTPGSYFIVSTRGDEALNPLSFFSSLDFDLLTIPDGERVRFDIVDESFGATRVFGQVLDGAEPIAGGSISALSWEGENFLGIDWKLGRIDGQGNYEFEGLTPGEYQFELRVRGRRSRLMIDVPDQPEYQRDLLLPTGTVSGVVIDRDSREPLRRARVFLRPLEEERGEGLLAGLFRREGRLLRDTTGKDGGFRFEGLSQGEYELLARPPAGGRARTLAPSESERLLLGEGGRVEGLTIELRPALSLAGTVVDGEGAPIEGAALLCRREAGSDPRPASARSDAQGAFIVGGLSAGSHTLIVSAEGFASGRRDGIEVGADAQAPIELVLERGVEVSIRVYGADGLPLSGASARLERTDAPDPGTADPGQAVEDLLSGEAVSDSKGRLTLGRFVPGVYELTVWRGFSRLTRPSVLLERAEGRRELRVDLQ